MTDDKPRDFFSQCNLHMVLAPNGKCAFCDPEAHGEPGYRRRRLSKRAKPAKNVG